MDKEGLAKEVENDVIPLEITGSVKVYNQAYVDKQEKRIEKLEGQVARAFEVLEGKRKQIADLEKENAELKEAIKHFNSCGEWNDDVHDCEFRHYAMEYGSKLAKAKELLKKVIKVTWGEGWNYSLGVKVEAEQFISEVEK